MPVQNIATLVVPLTIIALAIPLILQKVPRNGFYGLRTTFTMSSNEIWYYGNKITGIALLVTGIFWLVASRMLLNAMHDNRHAYRLVAWIGSASLVGGCVLSYWLTYRKYRK